MKKVKKAQVGDQLKKTSASLDSTVKAKVAGGSKMWTPEERAKMQKAKSSIGAPPPGFKPKKK